jgi:hypothetical protein
MKKRRVTMYVGAVSFLQFPPSNAKQPAGESKTDQARLLLMTDQRLGAKARHVVAIDVIARPRQFEPKPIC